MLRIWRFLNKSPRGGAGASTAPFNLRPLHNTIINETFLDVRRAVIASIKKDLPVPAFPLTKIVSREPISRVCET